MEINHIDMSGADIVLFTIAETQMLYIKTTNQFFRKYNYIDGSSNFKEQLFTKNGKGYERCTINKKKFLHHRLVYYANNLDWDILNSSIATNSIDHIDGNPENNNISNLRVVTHQQNQWNQKKAKGYYFNKARNKWTAQIVANGKSFYLGDFDNEQEARDAYLAIKNIKHPLP